MNMRELLASTKGRTALLVGGLAGAFLVAGKLKAKKPAATSSDVPAFTGIDAGTAAQMFGSQGGGVGAPASGVVTTDLAESLVHGYDDLATALDGQGTAIDSLGTTVSDLGAHIDTVISTLATGASSPVAPPPIATAPIAPTAPPPPPTAPTSGTPSGGGAGIVTPAQSPGVQQYAPKGWRAGLAGFFQANGHWNFINESGTIAVNTKAPNSHNTVFS